MQLIILCLGLLPCAYFGECALVWTAPAITADGGDGGVVAYIEQTDLVATVLYTVAVSTSTGITLTSQVPDTGVLKRTFGTAAATITLDTGKKIDYTAASTHVLVVTATDGTLTESATITLSVLPLYYKVPNMCITVLSGTAANALLATVVPFGASTKPLLQSGTSAGYTFLASDGTIKNDAAITPDTAAAQVNVITTSKEEFGTATTVTSTVVLCINGGCDCSTTTFPSSGASIVTAGLLSFVMLFFTKLN